LELHSEASTNKGSKTQRTNYNLNRSRHQQLQVILVYVEDNLEKQLFSDFLMASINGEKMQKIVMTKLRKVMKTYWT